MSGGPWTLKKPLPAAPLPLACRAQMRVLLISWEYPPVIEGGLGRHVRKLTEHLVHDGVEVHVLTRGGGRLPRDEERHGVCVHRVREPEFPRDPTAFVKWVEAMNADMLTAGLELCERFDFDLIHSHDWLVAGAAEELSAHSELPWLVTVHATEYGRHQGWVREHPQSHIHAAERRMVQAGGLGDHLLGVHARPRGAHLRPFSQPRSPPSPTASILATWSR